MSTDPNPDPPVDPTPKPGPPPGDPKTDPTPPPDPSSLVAESRKWETRAKGNLSRAEKAEADLKAERDRTQAILKAAGLAPDDDPTEGLKRAAAERDTERHAREAAERKVREMEMRDLARDLGEKAGANVAALLNTYSFRVALADLAPDAGEKEIGALVAAELDANPHLKTTAPVPTRTVREPGGQPAPGREPAPGLDRMRAAFAASPHKITR